MAADAGEEEEVSLFCESCRTTVETCTKCGLEKPICEFTHQSKRRGHCKSCYTEGRRAAFEWAAAYLHERFPDLSPGSSYYDQDPDEVLRRSKRRRAARLRAAHREPIDRQAIFERDGWVCGICGGTVEPKDATLDHIVPVALGGDDTPANVRLAHAICNSRRQADKPSWSFPSGWRPEQR